MFSTIQIKVGEKIFLCAHEGCGGYHFFEVLEDEQLVNDRGEVIPGRWILLCDECFALAHDVDDPAHFIARESTWEGEETLYLAREKAEKHSKLEIKCLN
jgi:predicted metal-dependent hydrolase